MLSPMGPTTFGWLGSRIIIGIWIAFALSMAGLYFNGHIISRRTDVLIYLLALPALWFGTFRLLHVKTVTGTLKLPIC